MEDLGRAYSGVDNLSRLPDELLSRILSLLCTEDAVRTSVLSTRWRYLYTSISNLTLKFNSEVLTNTDEQDCMNFVDRFLSHRKKCAIDKFKLKWKMSQAIDPRRLENWIEVVLGHGIRELDLCIYGFQMQDLLLPSSLFASKSLEVLKLNIWKSGFPRKNFKGRGYGLELPATVRLPSLKSIHLINVSFSEDSWSRLFPNCPILEDFFFNLEWGDCKLSVSSPMLKRLTIEQEYGFLDFFVDAPSLVYLGFSIDVPKSIRLENAGSLVEADIKVFRRGSTMHSSISVCSELMTGISNIQTLRISTSTLRFLMIGVVPIPVLQNMTHLTFFDCNRGLPTLQYLLQKCESLETLVFQDLCEWRSWGRNLEEFRIRCLTSVVKTIKVCEFMGKKSELEMVKYFLKVARALERMEIHLGFQCENLSETANELQMLPKISEALMDVIF